MTTNDNLDVVDKSDVVIMAVKPLIMEKVLQEIKPAVVDTSKLVVSIAAGIKIQNIQQNLQSESKVCRLQMISHKISLLCQSPSTFGPQNQSKN